MALHLSIARQVGDAFLGGSQLIQPCRTLYLLLNVFIHGLSRPKIIIQASFESSASFVCLAFRKPKPPLALGVQGSAQAFQAKNCPDSLLGFHQNQRTAASIFSQTTTGMLEEAKV